MHDLTNQLRQWSESLAQVADRTDLNMIKSPVIPADRFSTNRRWFAVAASVILVAAAVAAVATVGNGDSQRIGPATNPTQPTSSPTTVVLATTALSTTTTAAPFVPPPPGAVLTTTTAPTTSNNPDDRLVAWPAAPASPLPVEAVARLLPISSGTPVRGEAEGGSGASPLFTQVFADAERDILFTLQTQPNAFESTPAELQSPMTIDGWDDAFATVGDLRVVAQDPSGFVRLRGTGIGDDEAAAIISSMQRRPAGTPGWDLALEKDGLVEITGAWNDSAGQRFVTWFDGTRVLHQMLVSPAHTDLIVQALSPTFDHVEINGRDGWLNSTGDRRSIVWSPDGVTIVVFGTVEPTIDLLGVAETVTALDAAAYESRTTSELPAGLGDGCSGSLFC